MKETKKQFFWGSHDPHPISLFIICVFLGAGTVATAIRTLGEGTPAIESGLDLASVRWTITASVLYMFVYQTMLMQQMVLKRLWMCTDERALHVSDRIPLNTLEQMPLFLILMWLFSVYVDSASGGKLGLVYAFYTAAYAFCYAFYGQNTAMLFFSTFPRYFILHYMQASLMWMIHPISTDLSLREWLSPSIPLLSVQLFVGYFVMFVLSYVVTYPVVALNWNANAVDKQKTKAH